VDFPKKLEQDALEAPAAYELKKPGPEEGKNRGQDREEITQYTAAHALCAARKEPFSPRFFF